MEITTNLVLFFEKKYLKGLSQGIYYATLWKKNVQLTSIWAKNMTYTVSKITMNSFLLLFLFSLENKDELAKNRFSLILFLQGFLLFIFA
jgi:hypothetical protein